MWRRVGQLELEDAEDLALHLQQLALGVGVLHQVTQLRHLWASRRVVFIIE